MRSCSPHQSRTPRRYHQFQPWSSCLNCNEQTNDVLRCDHVVLINLELPEDIINFSLGHLVSPGFESMLKHLGFDLAFIVISLESLNNQVVGVISFSSHLLLEHVDHVVTSAGAVDLAKKFVQLAFSHQNTDIIKSSTQVIFVNGAILVDVHELKAVLIHLDLIRREPPSILALTHLELLL